MHPFRRRQHDPGMLQQVFGSECQSQSAAEEATPPRASTECLRFRASQLLHLLAFVMMGKKLGPLARAQFCDEMLVLRGVRDQKTAAALGSRPRGRRTFPILGSGASSCRASS